MSRFRRGLLLTGFGGLFVGALLFTAAAWLVTAGVIRPPLPYQAVALLFALVFGTFSLAEIPMMLFTMRRLAVERPGNHGAVLGLNSLYVSFAAVYAMPVLLFTGSLTWGLVLSALGVVRFGTSLILVRESAE